MNERDYHYLKIDSVLNGRYSISDVLGEGGFGITYIGKDNLFDRAVAIKEYFPHGVVARNHEFSNEIMVTAASQQDAYYNGKKRFISEARIMARFNDSPGIVHVTDYFEANNTAYIVMDYLDGVTLKEYLKGKGRIPVDDILALMSPLIEALDEIHKAGLIHRDISPDNIMVMSDGRVILMDFGAARDYTEFGERSLSIILKPGYAPAEQYQSRGVQGPWTDIYALSATIYRCITGIVPEDSIERVMEDHLKAPSQMGIRIPPKTEMALMKGMNVSPKNRYQNLKEFCDDLYAQEDSSSQRYKSSDTKAKKTSRAIDPAQKPPAEKGKKDYLPAIVAGTLVFLLIFFVGRLAGGLAGGGTDQGENGGSTPVASSSTEISEESDTTQETEETANTAATTEESSDNAALSDNLNDYTFILDDITYQLPFAYQKLAKKGWTVDDYKDIDSDTEIGGCSYETISMKKDGRKIEVTVYNKRGDIQKVKDCSVAGIAIIDSNNEGIEDKYYISAKKIGLTSSEDDVRKAFGNPDDLYEGTDVRCLTYKGTGDNTETKFWFNTGSYPYHKIEMKNISTTEPQNTEVSDEVPAYLDSYKAPSKLGKDPLSGNIKIDGKIYHLPCPYRELKNDGWEISDEAEAVPAAGMGYHYYSSIILKKGDNRLSVRLMNFSKHLAKPENSAVTDILISSSSDTSFELPGGITPGSSKKDLEQWALDHNFKTHDYDSSVTYGYYAGTDEKAPLDHLNVEYDKTQKKVGYISMEHTTWDQ